MPLQIKLPAWDKIIINGAVLQNGGTPLTLIVHNRADILRRKEVMSEDQANTPARRAYYCVQCAYLFEDQRADFMDKFTTFMEDYMRAAPSVVGLAEEVFEKLQEDRYYEALRAMRRVLEHEQVRLDTELYTGKKEEGGLGVSEDATENRATENREEKVDFAVEGRGQMVEDEEFVKESIRKVAAEPVKPDIKRKRRGVKSKTGMES